MKRRGKKQTRQRGEELPHVIVAYRRFPRTVSLRVAASSFVSITIRMVFVTICSADRESAFNIGDDST